MTTLGAKPNHAFFHCQHPAQKKTCGAPSNAPRARRESHHACLRRLHARSAPASAASKRNVVFKVVLFARLRARDGRARRERRFERRDDGIRGRINGSIRRFFPTAIFSRCTSRIARICANSKRRYAPFETHLARTESVSTTPARTHSNASKPASIDARFGRDDASKRRSEPSRATTSLRRGQRKSRPRSRGRFRQSLRAPPTTPA